MDEWIATLFCNSEGIEISDESIVYSEILRQFAQSSIIQTIENNNTDETKRK
jgi:hypothetical protein